jgi:ribosomal protein L37E
MSSGIQTPLRFFDCRRCGVAFLAKLATCPICGPRRDHPRPRPVPVADVIGPR